jgi:predicted ester cyclase
MRKTTLLVGVAALALVGAGCGKKKDKDATKTTTTTPAAIDAAVASTPPPPPPKPAKLEGDALARHFIECHQRWSSQQKDKFKDCYAKDATSRFADSMMPEAKGPDAIAANAFEFHAAFPDGKTEPQLVLVNGRNIASVLLFTGTNTAAMKMGGQSMPATNKKVGMHMLHLATFDDENRVTDEWWFMDDATFGAQLGMPGAQGGRPVVEQGVEGAPQIVVAAGSDTEKANVDGMAKAIATFNGHDLKAIMADWADDGVESDMASPADAKGKAEIEKGTKMFLTAFPDGKIDLRKSWAAGDYVVGVFTFSGTNKGKMGPMKATNKPVTFAVGELVKVEGGKVKQLWRFYNSYAIMVQMGLAPAPGAGGGAGSAAGAGASK